MRAMLGLLLAMIVLPGCTDTPKTSDQASSDKAALDKATPDTLGASTAAPAATISATVNESPQALMRELYRVHALGEGPLLKADAGALRRVFFTDSLAAALDQELNRPNSDEIGNLDFDPFFYAQDFEISGLDFAVAKVSGTSTVALAHFTNYGKSVEIAYRVVQDQTGWRIDDIEYGEGLSLRKILKGE